MLYRRTLQAIYCQPVVEAACATAAAHGIAVVPRDFVHQRRNPQEVSIDQVEDEQSLFTPPLPTVKLEVKYRGVKLGVQFEPFDYRLLTTKFVPQFSHDPKVLKPTDRSS